MRQKAEVEKKRLCYWRAARINRLERLMKPARVDSYSTNIIIKSDCCSFVLLLDVTATTVCEVTENL